MMGYHGLLWESMPLTVNKQLRNNNKSRFQPSGSRQSQRAKCIRKRQARNIAANCGDILFSLCSCFGGKGGKRARRSVSRVLSPRAGACGRWPFIWDARRRTPRATHPDRGAETRLRTCARVQSLFGLAPGGVCHAVAVAGDAVRSYRTLSPLPAPKGRRSALCGTFPGVAPAGRYPAPCFRGARTFLPPAGFPIAGRRPSDRLARRISAPRCRRRQAEECGRRIRSGLQRGDGGDRPAGAVVGLSGDRIPDEAALERGDDVGERRVRVVADAGEEGGNVR